ncbi:flagellar FlbD family protein, partial [bacterium AH-315-G05]|nr:flagellar FlbD family protein [bacterium AH-315-G05]
MITLKRLNDEEFLLNSDLIEFIDQTPDTIITLMNGHKYV